MLKMLKFSVFQGRSKSCSKSKRSSIIFVGSRPCKNNPLRFSFFLPVGRRLRLPKKRSSSICWENALLNNSRVRCALCSDRAVIAGRALKIRALCWQYALLERECSSSLLERECSSFLIERESSSSLLERAQVLC